MGKIFDSYPVKGGCPVLGYMTLLAKRPPPSRFISPAINSS